MQEILDLLNGKWDMFGNRHKNAAAKMMGSSMGSSISILSSYSFCPIETNTYSLADFANNKSVCEALARTNGANGKYIFTTDSDIKIFIRTKAMEINRLMLAHLYDHPNDSVGLEKIIKDWIR